MRALKISYAATLLKALGVKTWRRDNTQDKKIIKLYLTLMWTHLLPYNALVSTVCILCFKEEKTIKDNKRYSH